MLLTYTSAAAPPINFTHHRCSGTRTPGHSDSGDDGDEEEEEESSAFFNEPSNCLSLLGAFNKLSISGIKPEAKRRRVKVQKQGLPQAAATTTSAAVEAYLAARYVCLCVDVCSISVFWPAGLLLPLISANSQPD